MILWPSEVCPVKVLLRSTMLFLAITGGLGFTGAAVVAYLSDRWMMACSSAVLATTSALWHSTQSNALWVADQVAMFAFVGTAIHEASLRGLLPMGLVLTTGAYGVVIYNLGRHWKCWAFHPTEDSYYHMTLHVLPFVNLLAVFTFFPINNEAVPDLFLLPEGDRGAPAGPGGNAG
jgi:hypothetical protein